MEYDSTKYLIYKRSYFIGQNREENHGQTLGKIQKHVINKGVVQNKTNG